MRGKCLEHEGEHLDGSEARASGGGLRQCVTTTLKKKKKKRSESLDKQTFF